MQIITSDLSRFGRRELDLAADLLHKYVEQPSILGDGVYVMFNINSGYVFLTDEDFNVAMLNGDRLERWYSCGNCGHEGFAEEFKHIKNDDEKLRCLCGEVIFK